MTSIPSSLSRVPSMLSRQFMLTSINNTSRDLLRTNIELASGRSLLRPSDDAVSASTVSVLDDLLERREQRLRNLSHAESVMNNVDAALADASDLVIEARGIGLSQIGVGSDAQTRENQSLVIDAMLDELYAIGNRQYQDIHYFGGNATANEPFTQLLGGIGYIGQGDGLRTDLGVAQSFAITLPGTDAFGAMSARVEGARDLNPALTTDTRLSDLNGARGLGVAIGSINADINGTDITVDLTNAHTIGDVINTLQADLAAVDPGATVGIAATGDALEIVPSGGVTITISDLIAEGPAADLGISQAFPPGGAAGSDLDPRITEITPVADLLGITAPLGTIRLENAGQTRDLDLSGAQTVQDIMNLVDGLNIGIRVEIADSGDRLNFLNELSGGLMSIAEVGGGDTATQLGVRSLTYETRLEDFREGLGVEIISGSGRPDHRQSGSRCRS
jgi:flagellar hook-associated protein 3 FlgL